MQTTFHYTLRDTTLVVSEEGLGKNYVGKIRDWPDTDRPREKLMQHGPQTLSNQELLAVVLNTGTKKESVVAMARKAFEEYGERSLASQRDPKALASDLDIPLFKATQIVACAELGRRFFQRSSSDLPLIRTARDVYEYAKELRDLPKEHLRGLYLNTHYRVIHDEVLSIGTINANVIHPREVFRPALQYAAAAVVLVHNHPSGDTTPSEADIEVTQQIVATGKIVGIDLIDHVIVGPNSFTSVPVHYLA